MSIPSDKLRQRLRNCSNLKDLEQLVTQTPADEFDPKANSIAISLLGENLSRNRPVINKLITQAKSSSALFGPEELARFCYGVSTGQLLSEIPNFIIEQVINSKDLEDYTSYELASVVIALAALDQKNLALCNKIAEEIVTRDLDEFETLEITSIVESLEALQYVHPKLMKMLKQEVITRG